MCVLAGAGTGKTRAITHRIAYGVHSGVYSPQRLLAVTFTARAAAEMRSRLRDLGVGNVQARTFHAAALRQLQFFWPQAVGGVLPNLLDHKAQMIAEAARRLRLSTDRASIRDLASEIEWAKVSMLTPANYLEKAQGRGTPGGFDLTAVARVFQSYEDVKTDRNVIDFEDVLLITVGILQEDPKVAATVREQYRHFVVDEYQDVSPLQQRLLELWLGGRDELCVVGDASQTIYSFTGASPKHLLGFKAQYPEATVVKLIRDYRSTPQVVKLANELLGGRRSGGPAADAAWATPLQLVAQRPPGPVPQFTECSDDEAEAATVAVKVRELLDAGTPGQPDRRAVPHQRPVRGLRTGPGLGGDRLPAARRGTVLCAQGSPRRHPAAAGSHPGRRRNRQPRAAGPARPRHRRLAGIHGCRPAQRRCAPGTLGVARGTRGAGRRARGQPRRPVHPLGLRQRTPGTLPRPARPDRPGRHPRLAARRQGPRMGRRVPRRAQRGPHADLLRRQPRVGRRGTPPAVRRDHPGQGTPVPVLVHRAHPGRARQPEALALPGRSASRLRSQLLGPRQGTGATPQGRRAGHLPGLRDHALLRRRTQGGPLQPVPAQLRGADLRRAPAMAQGRSPRRRRPRLRGLHRRHTDGHCRSPARIPRTTRQTARGGTVQAGEIRRGSTGSAGRKHRQSDGRPQERPGRQPGNSRSHTADH